MSKCAIIMSSYNGEKYIKEQIESILASSHSDFELFIRDDGSSDSTVSIIKDFESKDPRVKLVLDKVGEKNTNLGFGKSFATTLKYALDKDCFDYFAFCDQDDYWEKDKIKNACCALDKVAPSKPALFASNYLVCDGSLNEISTFCDGNPMDGVTFENLFFEGVFPGFCIVINKALAQLAFGASKLPNIYYHDKWVTLIALGMGGEIVYDKTPLARYRRHAAAASSTNLGLMKKLKWRISNVLNGDFCPRTALMLKEYKAFFYDASSEEVKAFLTTFTGNSKFKKLFYKKGLRRSASGEFLIRIILLLGKL